MDEESSGATDLAAIAAGPAPVTELADIWDRLAKRRGRPLNWSALTNDCHERYLRRGMPLQALRNALEELCDHPHWVVLPNPPLATKARSAPTGSITPTAIAFELMDYTKVPK